MELGLNRSGGNTKIMTMVWSNKSKGNATGKRLSQFSMRYYKELGTTLKLDRTLLEKKDKHLVTNRSNSAGSTSNTSLKSSW